MSLIVKKFGGTSVSDIDNIKNVASVIKSAIVSGDQVIAVVSAMAGVTNDLISKCFSVSELTTTEQIREYDASVSSGEIITASLLALQLDSMGIKAKSLQGWQIPIQTNNNAGDALVEKIPTDTINNLINEGYTPIITGFQGVVGNDVTTLGKGGSDTTAALIAAAINADRCDIYTDVDGVFSADPRVVDNAFKIPYIDANLMLRLSELGAKVLHPRAAQAAVRYNINMRIISSFNKSETPQRGTRIEQKQDASMEDTIIKALTGDRNRFIIKIIVPESITCSRLLNSIHEFKLDYLSCDVGDNCDNDTYSVTLQARLTDKNKYQKCLEQLQNQQLLINYHYNTDIATISLVGYAISNKAEHLKSRVLNILSDVNIPFYNISCSSTDMTLVIDDHNLEKSKKSLHVLVDT